MTGALESWSEFNVALVGATSALAGLVIVASSVNIAEIIKSFTLTARLAAAIAALVLALVVCGAGLIPDVDPIWYAVVIVATTAVAAVFQFHATRVIYADPEPEHTGRLLKSVLGFAPIACYVAAAVALFAGHPAGLVLAAAGALVAIVAAIVVSWVALVEVLR